MQGFFEVFEFNTNINVGEVLNIPMPTCGPLSGAFGLEAGMDLYWSIPAMTQDLGFYSLVRKIVPFITKFIASYNRFPTI